MSKLTTKLPWDQSQPLWAAQLNPVIANPLVNGQLIQSISLVASTPLVIRHSLGQNPQGWLLTDTSADSTVWRDAWNDKSITLEASADTTIGIWIF